VVAGSTTLLCVTVGTLTAYALARLRFRGQTAVLSFILALTIFPEISIVSPLYLMLRALRLIDTWPGLVLPLPDLCHAARRVAPHGLFPPVPVGP
jgi:ABC-type glycerol-3-phosphate transport system permease component